MAYSKTFFAEFPSLINEEAIEARIGEVTPDRVARIRATSRLETKASLLASGLILNAVLREAGITDFSLTKNEFGKPSLAGDEKIHFNLSHSGTVVCCTISDVEVGVDIEKIDAPHDMMRIADRFFSPFEYGAIQMSPNPAEAFCRLWTLRESYVKMRGTGFSVGLSALRCDFHRGICTMYENNLAQKDAHFCEFRNIYGYRGSVCTKEEASHEVHRISI